MKRSREKTAKEIRELSLKERFSFGCAVAAGGIGTVMLASYISYYYTDVVGFTAALAASAVPAALAAARASTAAASAASAALTACKAVSP